MSNKARTFALKESKSNAQRTGAAFCVSADGERAFHESPAALSLLLSLSATEALSQLNTGHNACSKGVLFGSMDDGTWISLDIHVQRLFGWMDKLNLDIHNRE